MIGKSISGRAMLVHSGALGDFILSLRIVATLREAGASGVTILGRPGIAVLATLDGQVDRVLDFETGGFHALFDPQLPLSARVVGDLVGHALTINMAAVDSLEFSRRLAETTGGCVIEIDPRVRDDWTGHITEQWAADLLRHGFLSTVGVPTIRIASGSPRSGVVIHPGSGGLRKCWPLKQFIALAMELDRLNRSPVFLLGPVELETCSEGELKSLSRVAPLVRDRPLVEVAQLLAGAEHVVANDSGIAHLAAAVGARVTAILGPTDPNRWRPLGPNVAVVSGQPWPETDTVLAAIDALPPRR